MRIESHRSRCVPAMDMPSLESKLLFRRFLLSRDDEIVRRGANKVSRNVHKHQRQGKQPGS